MAAPTARADHVRISIERPPEGAAVGLLIAGKGKTVSREAAQNACWTKVPAASCPCPITIYLTLPRGEEHNVRRYRIAIAGGGYRGLLVSDRTRIPGLVSIYDIEPTVKALDDGDEPPLTSRDEPDPEAKLRELDARLTRRTTPAGPASYVVFGLGALFALLTLILGSAFWGRAALLVGPVALAAALALSALEVTRPRTSGSRCSASSAAARWRSPPSRAGGVALAAALLSIFAVYLVVLATSQETSSLAAFGPHPDGGVRFYGISNQVETLLLVPGLLGAALLGRHSCPSSEPSSSSSSAQAAWARTAAASSSSERASCSCGCGCAEISLTARNLALAAGAAVAVGLVLVGLDAALGGSSHISRTLGDGPGDLAGELAHRWRVVARRVRLHLARDGDHLGVARRPCLARTAPAALDRRRRRARRARRVAARQRLPAGRRCIWRNLVRCAPILVRRVE